MNERRRFAYALARAVACGLVLASGRPAAADVDCNQPANVICPPAPECLLTGDVTGQLNCTLDLGSRAVVVYKDIVVPDGGSLEIKAGTISVEARISVAKPRAQGAGVILDSVATLTTKADIDVSGDASAGVIALTAGGDLIVEGRLLARAFEGNQHDGGRVILSSTGGEIRVATTSDFAIDVEGAPNFSGGQAQVTANGSITFESGILADGATGGDISMSSTNGSITTQGDFRAVGRLGNGGFVTMAAARMVHGNRKRSTFSVRGKGFAATGGAVVMNASGGILLDRTAFDARGRTKGGNISLATTDAAVEVGGPRRRSNKLDVSSPNNGGRIQMEGEHVTIARTARLRARSGALAGQSTIALTTLMDSGGEITVAGELDARPSGTIRVHSDGPTFLLEPARLVAGRPGGCVEIQAPGIFEEDGIRVIPAFVPMC
jgi:hypothetical protein